MQITSRIVGLLGLAGLMVLVSTPSQAVQFTLQAFVGGSSVGTLNETQLGCSAGDITATCGASNLTLGSLRIESLSMSLDTDPIINGVVAVQNLAGTTQQFTMLFTLLVSPVGPSSLTGGSVAGGVTDNNGNGATLATSTISKNGLFTAMIDGAAYHTLFPHPTSLVAGPFDGADLVPGAFGVPIPSQAGPAVSTSIGIRYDFTLTAQDSASFTGVFNVQPIPEPSTLLLLGLGLVAVTRVGRRR